MKITHNKVGQNLNTTDAKGAEKSAQQSKIAGVKQNSKTSDASSVKSAEGGSQATKVELSSRVQDIKKIKELATSAPDVDAAKVEKFKKLIAEGKYKVDAKAVADKMVDEHMKSSASDT